MNNGASAVDSSKRLGWIRRFVRRRDIGSPALIDVPDTIDSLLAFAPESAQTPETASGTRRPSRRFRRWPAAWVIVLAASAFIAAGVPTVGQLRAITTKPANPSFGKVSIETRPTGVRVVIDGEERGAAPLTLSLTAGPHAITLFKGLDQRKFSVLVTAGNETSHYVEFAPSAPTPSTGTISVTADVVGKVTIDGRPRGSSPVTLTDVLAGQHTVAVTGDAGHLERTVTVEPGATASVVFSLPRAVGPAAGWLSVAAPFELQVYDATELIGSGAAAKIMLTAGRHDVRLVNASLEFETARRVDVAAGKVAMVQVEAPMSSLSANARPWAEVVIDGTSAGQTPLADVPIRVGNHQVVFKHPQFGEQTQAIRVTVNGPNRISADMTRKK